MTVEVLTIDGLDSSEVRHVVESAFGGPRAPDQWTWKHRDGPWGPTTGVAAVEAGRIIAVRLLLPWALHLDGSTVLVRRAVDAATLPEASGRGLFSRLNQRLMDDLRARAGWCALFSTPNANSRRVYLRLGWRWLPPIHHRYSVVLPLPRRGRHAEATDPVALVPPRPPTGMIGTDWTADAWRWRVDPRCGSVYQAARLADAASGMVYRVTRRKGVPFLTVFHLWGTPTEQSTILRSVATLQRAPLALCADGPVSEGLSRFGRRRGESLLAVWGTEHGLEHPGLPIYDPSRWWAPLIDLERVL